MLENSNYKLYYDSSIIIDRTVHNNRPDTVINDKTTKDAYLIEVAIPSSHNFHSTITEKLQNYTDLKKRFKNMETENSPYFTTSNYLFYC
jgi:hypothetical protein